MRAKKKKVSKVKIAQNRHAWKQQQQHNQSAMQPQEEQSLFIVVPALLGTRRIFMSDREGTCRLFARVGPQQAL